MSARCSTDSGVATIRMATPLPMNRFRPNIVVRGRPAWEEDAWRELRGEQLSLSVLKPCSRCNTTTVDQTDASRGIEPLRTLAGFRRQGNKVYFGQNLLHAGPGELAVEGILQTAAEGPRAALRGVGQLLAAQAHRDEVEPEERRGVQRIGVAQGVQRLAHAVCGDAVQRHRQVARTGGAARSVDSALIPVPFRGVYGSMA